MIDICSGKWQNPDNFGDEIYSKISQKCRQAKKKLLKGKKIFVENRNKFGLLPTKSIIEKLCRNIGASIVNKYWKCDICISHESIEKNLKRFDDNIEIVIAKWLFDTIGEYRLKETKKYQIKKNDTDTESGSDNYD